MSLANQRPAAAKDGDGPELTGKGMGEQIDFLNQDNHIFINKLNYICKNYDTSFKDVSDLVTLRLICPSLILMVVIAPLGETHEIDDGGYGAHLP